MWPLNNLPPFWGPSPSDDCRLNVARSDMQTVESHLYFKPPMECKEVKSVRNVPRGEQWQYELKFDGYPS
jgi:ATP-dependent DNA ligase